MSRDIVRRPTPPPLPVAADQWTLKIKKRLTLADQVQVLHEKLRDADGADYIRYFNAEWDEDSVEGWTKIDRGIAAQKVRTLAESETGYDDVVNAKLSDIVKALHTVQNRFGFGRKDRLAIAASSANGADGANAVDAGNDDGAA